MNRSSKKALIIVDDMDTPARARTRTALEEVLDELVQARLGLTPDKGQ